MASNTKLTPAQKDMRKTYKKQALAAGVQVINLDYETVMVYKHKGNTVEFTLAVKSPKELKFRVKVGEYYALDRYFAGDTVKMKTADFVTMCGEVWDAYLM